MSSRLAAERCGRAAARGTSSTSQAQGHTGRPGATFTFGADAALLRDPTISTVPTPAQQRPGSGPRVDASINAARWLSTIGLGAQAALNIRETVYFTAGLRSERNDGFTDASRFVLLPSIGASLVRQVGDATWKGRIAYGAGMRPACNPMRETAWRGTGSGGVDSDLLPEKQEGVEAGIDFYWRRNFSLQVTRFDQLASSLIQQVPILEMGVTSGDTSGGRMGYAPLPRYAYLLENLGAITNRGWELAVRQSAGALSIAGLMSLVQSRVTRRRASVAHDLTRGLSLRLIGDNLLDRQRGEPDNVTIVPGRSVSFGIAARF